jgi:2-succinyl-6-hydroxy-2,4-cyclohexadiene-1-carboxylate synthase
VGLHAERLGQGEVRVILVHGFTQTGRSWSRIAGPLAKDHEVVVVDAPGHGASSEVHADLVEGAELLGDAGGRGVYLGYSMGGRLCLHLALARPNLVRGLVLLGATAGIEDDRERRARQEADDALAVTLEEEGIERFVERWLAGPLFASLPDDAAQRSDRLRNTIPGLASSLRLAGTGSQAPLWDRLPELRMPVLVLAGEEDRKFSDLGRRMVDAIGANATFATVAQAGHAAHLERPDAVLALLTDWLAQRDQA